MSSPNRQYKIMNTFTEEEVKYIQKKMKGYDCEIKYNSFNEINKKYLTRQTKQELYDTCVAQKKEIEELKKEKKSGLGSISPDNTMLQKYKEKCIELKKENDKLLKVAEGKNKIYDRELFEDNKEFAEENLELLAAVKEREEYIENVSEIVRKLDKIMEEQKKEIEDLKQINEGISEELEEAEEKNQKYDKEIETIEDKLHDSYKKQILGLKSEIKEYEDSWEEATAKVEKDTKEAYENKIKRRDRTIASLQETNKKLQETVKKYEVVVPFLDEKQVQKTVKKNEKKQKKEQKVQFKSSPEKKVVKKSIYEEKYNEAKDILSKYS